MCIPSMDYAIVDDDFEVFDVVTETRLPQVNVCENAIRVVYIDKERYDRELLRGQEHAIAAYSQFAKDVHRCAFFMNGRPLTRACASLPLKLLRFCTQAVMALPLEILGASSLLVAEQSAPRKMRVYASETTVHVSKELRILQDERWVPVEITVQSNIFESVAVITFHFGSVTALPCGNETMPIFTTTAIVTQ